MVCTRPWLFKSDEGVIYELPCGRCIACRIAKKREWSVRLENELCYHSDSCFITLTYDDTNLPIDGGLVKDHVQRFFKRFRKCIYPQKIRYFAVGEYGDHTLRPHYHIILYGWKPPLHELFFIGEKGRRKYYGSKLLLDLWYYGNNYVGVCEPKSISYVAGYCVKKLYGDKAKEVYGSRIPPFLLVSKGLGLKYAEDNAEKIEEHGVVIRGKNHGVPAYYYKKLGIEKNLKLAIKLIKDRNDRHYSGLDLSDIHKIEISARRQKEKDLEWKEKNL